MARDSNLQAEAVRGYAGLLARPGPTANLLTHAAYLGRGNSCFGDSESLRLEASAHCQSPGAQGGSGNLVT